MAEIRVLDQHTAELIAAGEVVERPASVVKELLENSIDAGATQVSVSIEKGGISLIQVADNGSGIGAEYLPTAFIRHATSKIATEEDLDNIHTLGFRGEALPSIASVSRMSVLTRTEEDEFACVYRIEGGQELGIEASARPVGTTIEVRDLFYNTPARMKFLKKDSSEATYVSETVGHIALSHPEVSVSFTKDGKTQYKTPGDGKLRSAVYAVLGREFAKDLLDTDEMFDGYRVQGLITPPRCCRGSRGMQHFFINGRYVKNRTMMAALENSYRGTLMQGRFPGCVLMLTMPCQLVDVNVHPAKTEVRFSREKDVFDIVYRSCKTALAAPGSGEQILELEHGHKPGAAPAAQPEPVPEKLKPLPEIKPVQPAPGSLSARYAAQPAKKYWDEPDIPGPEEPMAVSGTASLHSKAVSMSGGADRMGAVGKNIFAQKLLEQQQKPRPMPAPKAPTEADLRRQKEMREQWSRELDEIRQAATQQEPEQAPAAVAEPEERVPPEPAAVPVQEAFEGMHETVEQQPMETGSLPLVYLGEAFKTYIITQRGDEICFIDKHAAHERIIYERIAATYGNPGSQMLLVPVTVNLSAEEKQAVLENAQMLADAGVEVEDFGGMTMLVRAVPADIPVDDAEGLLCELAAKLAKGSKDARSEHTQWVLHSISCRAAVKAGDKSNRMELMSLAQDILDEKVPPFCPHGRPVVLRLTKKELEKQFGRMG